MLSFLRTELVLPDPDEPILLKKIGEIRPSLQPGAEKERQQSYLLWQIP